MLVLRLPFPALRFLTHLERSLFYNFLAHADFAITELLEEPKTKTKLKILIADVFNETPLAKFAYTIHACM